MNKTPSSGSVDNLFNRLYTNAQWSASSYAVGDTLFTITTPFEIKDFTMTWNRPVYKPQLLIKLNGEDILETEYETVIDTPQPHPVDYVFPGIDSGYTYTLPEPQTGEYYAIATESGAETFAMNTYLNIGSSLVADGLTLTVTTAANDTKLELYRNGSLYAQMDHTSNPTSSITVAQTGTYYAVRTRTDGTTFQDKRCHGRRSA